MTRHVLHRYHSVEWWPGPAEWAGIASAAAGARRMRLVGARHLDFTDAALAAPLVAGAERRWARWGPIDGARSG